jgi:hypothetical protein
MGRRTVCVFGIALWALSTTTARAQDKGDAGLTISAPSAIGIIWHPSERLAIRPDYSFGITETDGEATIPDIRSKNVTLGVSALIYTHRWDELRLYVSPRFTYSHATTSIDSPVNLGDSTLSSWGAAGSIGGQYAVGTRFGVFAEAGLSYSSQRSETGSISAPERTTWTFGTRTAVGGILYF